MKINSVEQLNRARVRCKSMVTKRALMAGVSSAMPGAAVGVAADVAILLEVLPKINRAFGLDPEQIDELDEQLRQQIFSMLANLGSKFVGRKITSELILSVLKSIGIKVTSKTAASMVPVVGSVLGGALGFAMMKYVCNQHIKECYDFVDDIIKRKNLAVS